MNTVKNFTTIHFLLNQVDVLEVVMPLMTNKVCVPNKTEDLNLILFNMITVINESFIESFIYLQKMNLNE